MKFLHQVAEKKTEKTTKKTKVEQIVNLFTELCKETGGTTNVEHSELGGVFFSCKYEKPIESGLRIVPSETKRRYALDFFVIGKKAKEISNLELPEKFKVSSWIYEPEEGKKLKGVTIEFSHNKPEYQEISANITSFGVYIPLLYDNIEITLQEFGS